MTRYRVSGLIVGIALLLAILAPKPAFAAQDLGLQMLIFIEGQYNKANNAGQVDQALQWAKQGYDMAAQQKNDSARMYFSGYVAIAAGATGDYILSHNARNIQKELAYQFNDGYQYWAALNGLGTVSLKQKHLDEALDWYTRAMKQARHINDDTAENSTLSNRGMVYADMGLVEKARWDFDASLAFNRKVGSKSNEATVMNAIGLLYLSSKPAKAKKHFEAVLVLNRQLGNKRDIAMVLGNLGAALGNMDRSAEALDYDMQALQIYQEIGDKYGEWCNSNNIALSLRKLRRFKEASEYQAHADFLKRQGGF